MPFAAVWVDLENVTHGEVNQTEKDENYMINYMWTLKEVIPVNPHTKQEQTCRRRKQTAPGEKEGETDEERGANRYKLLRSNKQAPRRWCSTGSYIQDLVIMVMGNNLMKLSVYRNHFAAHLKLTQCCIQ